MTEMIYEYDGSFEGFLTCIFESYAQKEVLTAISCGEDIPFMLFPVRTVLTDRDHAARVYRKVVKLSPEAADLLRRGFLTCLPDREMHLYRLVVKLLEEGPRFLRDLSDETLYPILRAVRHLNGEVHQYKGFVRFSDLGGVLGGEIEPKNRVLPLLRRHFCDRYRNERFFLYPPGGPVLRRGPLCRPAPGALPDGPARRGGGPLPPAVEAILRHHRHPGAGKPPLPHDPHAQAVLGHHDGIPGGSAFQSERNSRSRFRPRRSSRDTCT